MRNHGGGQWIKSRPDPKVTLAQMSRLFIDILYIAAVVIVRTINSERKKKNLRKLAYFLVFKGNDMILLRKSTDGDNCYLQQTICFL